MDPSRNSNRTLMRSTAVGVFLSVLTTAATFTDLTLARELTFLRYPLFGAAVATLLLTGWSTGRLSSFNRTLWLHAPWWARLSWLAVIAAALAVFASISVATALPPDSDAEIVLETRGMGAVAAYFFLIAGLRGNVDKTLTKDNHNDQHQDKDFKHNTPTHPPDSERHNRKAAG